MAKGLPSVVEVLRKQLTLSESTIRDLREEIRCLQCTIERISEENRELKNMIQVCFWEEHYVLFVSSFTACEYVSDRLFFTNFKLSYRNVIANTAITKVT